MIGWSVARQHIMVACTMSLVVDKMKKLKIGAEEVLEAGGQVGKYLV